MPIIASCQETCEEDMRSSLKAADINFLSYMFED